MSCAETITIMGMKVLKTDKCIHLDKHYYGKPSAGHFRGGAYCGHGSIHIQISSNKDLVTCPNCIDMFPENRYK